MDQNGNNLTADYPDRWQVVPNQVFIIQSYFDFICICHAQSSLENRCEEGLASCYEIEGAIV